jgi:hypothetical protein
MNETITDETQNNNQHADPQAASNLPEWMGGLTDPELSQNKYLHSFKSLDSLAQSAVKAKQTLSRKLTDIPGDDADEEAWKNFHSQIAKVEKPDQYKITLMTEDENGEKQPISINNKNTDKLLRTIAHKAGMTNFQFNEALKGIMEYDQNFPKQAEAELKKTWGDNFEENDAIARKQFEALPEELRSELSTAFGPHPIIAKLMHHLGKNDVHSDTPVTPTSTDDLESMKAEFKQIQSDPVFINPSMNIKKYMEMNPRYHELGNKLMKSGVDITKI